MPVEWIYVAIVRLKTVQYLLNDGWKNHRADNSGLDFCRISFRYSCTCIEALTGIKKGNNLMKILYFVVISLFFLIMRYKFDWKSETFWVQKNDIFFVQLKITN